MTDEREPSKVVINEPVSESDVAPIEPEPPKETEPENAPEKEPGKESEKEPEIEPEKEPSRPGKELSEPQLPEEPKPLSETLKNAWNSIYNHPYRYSIVACTILFLFTLEIYRELMHIAIPLYLYRPYRKFKECVNCVSSILSSC